VIALESEIDDREIIIVVLQHLGRCGGPAGSKEEYRTRHLRLMRKCMVRTIPRWPKFEDSLKVLIFKVKVHFNQPIISITDIAKILKGEKFYCLGPY
jgi:hypothetical protein